MANTIFDDDAYFYKLIPELGFISYFEKKYWTETPNSPEKDRYDTDPFSILFNLKEHKAIHSYRALVVSEIPLKFEYAYDQIIKELKPYSGRYVYAVFASDIDKFRKDIVCYSDDLTADPTLGAFILRF